MPRDLTSNSFSSTYKDDWRDSDNYSRILFRAGRALQARELTQMQTIIQEEIRKFANNVFEKDGVPVKAGGVSVNNAYTFIKISEDTNNKFDDVDSLVGTVLTGQTSQIKVKIVQAVAAENSDPDTIYVQYLDDPTTRVAYAEHDVPSRVTLGETLLNDGGDVSLVVQTTNTAANPALGAGSIISVNDSTFYANGHFVFVPKQTIFLAKYDTNQTENIGFKIVQDIITVSDTDALYDNQGAVPNRASPGADRYRLRLLLTKQSDIVTGDTYVHFAKVEGGTVVDQITSNEGYNEVKKFVRTRIKEINGDFIKRYWKLRVEPNGTNNASDRLMFKIDPGVAYIDGHRVATEATRSIPVPKARDTIVRDDPQEQIGIDFGNYYYFDSGVGMLDINTCEPVTLYAGFGGADSAIGTANVRAITEGTTNTRTGGYDYLTSPLYKLHLFNVNLDNFNYTLRDVKSIKSNSDSHLVNLTQAVLANNTVGTILHEPRKNALIFDTPLRRPKSFDNITLTVMKKYNIPSGNTSYTITGLSADETFVRESDIIIAANDEFNPNGVDANIQSSNKEILLTGLNSGKSYEVITFVKRVNASVKSKTLTETTVSGTLDSDGQGTYYLALGKSDIYSIDRVRTVDSDGTDVFVNFNFDAGHRTTHYDDGRLIWTRGGLDSAGQTVFARFKYFEHSANGEFFAVNSYDNQAAGFEIDYLKIPAQKLPNGNKVSMRDVIDLRPATDGSGSFVASSVPALVEPTATIQCDAEYYLPRHDKLVISKNSELRYLVGSSSLNPKFPDVPVDCIDLYKIKMNANTMHSQDLEMTLIPRKGYTMQDIGKLEEKIDRLEELTSLSLLELNTKFLEVLDSAGNVRTKSGFFVDNFANHKYTQTKNKENRSAIDKRNLYMRPSFVEDTIDLYYDSAHSGQSRTTKVGDLVMLDYNEVPYQAQDLASGTENLAPFYNFQSVGRLTLSPETDAFYETEKVGETVVGTSTEFDLKKALNWNNSENEWFGVDPSSLEVGSKSTFQTGTSTSIVHNSSDPVLLGQEITVDLGEWVETGTVTDVETLSTETVEVSRERQEEIDRSVVDVYWQYEDYWYGYDFVTDAYRWNGQDYYYGYGTGFNVAWRGAGYSFPLDVIETTTNMYDVVTVETRERVKNVNTTTYEATKTINTENTYEGTAEIVTTTTTSNTVNRIASDSTIRETVGEKIIDVSVIPFMRSIKIFFKADGLRPNTQYFPFFDGSAVAPFCRSEGNTESAFKLMSDRHAENASSNADDEGVVRTTQEHSDGTTTLIANSEGSVYGSFEVPNNASMRFLTGVRTFALLDVNAHNFASAMSYARANFTSAGTLTKYEDEVHVTRVLKVVGENFNDVERDVRVDVTQWTENVVDTEIATDVQSTSTISTLVTDTTTTKEYVTSETTTNYTPLTGTTPIDHTVETGDTSPPGGTTSLTVVPTVDDEGQSTTTVPAKNQYDRSEYSYIDHFTYEDPLAQTFIVDELGGVTLTSVQVYFSSKADNEPVFCEIRPTVNGVPSATKVIGYKKLSPSQVTTVPAGSSMKQMLTYGTTFTFDEPLYLSQGEYALVLKPGNNSPDYNVYVGTVGEFQLGSQESFISQQPTLGAFFKSQNGKLWEPSSGQDLAYKLNIAQFKSSGNVILENFNVPPVALSSDPLRSFTGDSATSNTIFVMQRGHGLRQGDKTILRGIDSAEDFGNGLTGADVNGVRTVVSADNAGYTFELNSGTNATKPKWFGGQSVTSSRNMNFEVVRPEINVIQPSTTNVTFSMKTTTQQSLAGDETRFRKDTKFELVENQKNNYYKDARAIYNRRTENLTGAGKLNGNRSATMEINLTTTNPLVSPVIDLQRAKLNCIHNLISKQDSAATDGFNVPLTYIGERNPQNGTESAKHVTVVTKLVEEAVGLKILLAANKPPLADFQVYYKVGSEGSDMNRLTWNLVNPEETLPSDTNPNIFREYRYLVGGDGGFAKPFTQFQLKIVMRSTSSAQVPLFRDLRAIALAV